MFKKIILFGASAALLASPGLADVKLVKLGIKGAT